MLAVWMQWNRMIHHHDQFLCKNTNSHSFLPQYPRVLPIITPRFAISCSQQLMDALGLLAIEKDLHVQVCTDGYYIKQHLEFFFTNVCVKVLNFSIIQMYLFLKKKLKELKKKTLSQSRVIYLIRRWGFSLDTHLWDRGRMWDGG